MFSCGILPAFADEIASHGRSSTEKKTPRRAPPARPETRSKAASAGIDPGVEGPAIDNDYLAFTMLWRRIASGIRNPGIRVCRLDSVVGVLERLYTAASFSPG